MASGPEGSSYHTRFPGRQERLGNANAAVYSPPRWLRYPATAGDHAGDAMDA
jgi:hypothetical protein